MTEPAPLTPGPSASDLPPGAEGDRVRHKSREHRSAIGATHLGITYAEYQRNIDEGRRWCRVCKRWQPIVEMATRKSRIDGIDNLCKAASREIARRNMARLRQQRGGQAS